MTLKKKMNTSFSCHSCCYNKILKIWWLINNRNLLLPVLEAGKSKIRVSAWPLSGENPIPDS